MSKPKTIKIRLNLSLSPSSDLIKGYQERNRKLIELKKRPHLGYPEPRKYGPWIKAIILFAFLNYVVGSF